MTFTVISQNNHQDLPLSEGRYPGSVSHNMREHDSFMEKHGRLEIIFQLFHRKIQSTTEAYFLSFSNKAFTSFIYSLMIFSTRLILFLPQVKDLIPEILTSPD